jgi:ATP synthase protein I
MTKTGTRFIRLPFARWLIAEGTMLIVLGLLWSFESRLAAYSAVLGGLIYVVPNAYFAHRMFRFQGARNVRLMVGDLFRAESIKLALTAVSFAAVFILIEPVHAPALLFTFAVMVVLSTALRWFIQPQTQR